MRGNRLKAELDSGGHAIGALVSTGDEQVVEILALCGFDYIFIDSEHGNMSVRDCERLVRAADVAGATPLIRPPANRPELILRALDTGARGVIIPQINMAVDVEQAVEAVYYHPRGQRGLAGGRAAGYGLEGSLADYTRRVNDELMLVGMIETAQAVENLSEILQVGGLSAIYVGPSDLSQSFGHPGEPHQPEVAAAISDTIRHARHAGMPVGLHTANSAASREALAIGVQLVSVSAWGMLAGAARNYLSDLEV